MKPKLVIIGASYLQIPLIEKANDLGYETHVFAWEDGAVGKKSADFFYPISITEKERILEISASLKPVGVISIASDLAMVTVNYIADKLNLIGNSQLCTKMTTNKVEMRKVLSKAGLPCPKFTTGTSTDQLKNIHLIFPLIVKPSDRSGSKGVTLINKKSELKEAFYKAKNLSFSKEVIIEEFIAGREISIEAITWNGKHQIVAFTDKDTTGPPFFVENGQHQPAKLSVDQRLHIKGIVEKALSVLKVKYGASHTELLITPKGEIFFVEIGARMGGDNIGAVLVKQSTGYDFVKGVIEVATGKEPIIKINNIPKYCGIYYFTSLPGRISKVYHDRYTDEPWIKYEFFLKPGDIVQKIDESVKRLGYAIYCTRKRRPKLPNAFQIKYL